MTGPRADLELSLERPRPYDLLRTLSPFRSGAGDPTIQLEPGRVIRATRTPDGPATFEVDETADTLVVRAWGPGSAWAIDRAPGHLGLADDPSALVPQHPLVAELAKRLAGVRIGRSERVVEALVPAVLGQKITGDEARRVYRALVRTFGEAAPGPHGLRLQPSPEQLAELPYYVYHPIGLERRRAETLRRIGLAAARLETAPGLPIAEAHRLLESLLGVGPWTAGEVARDALGDPDAVSVGDYHLPSLVCFALAREPRGDDRRMLELLEPYRGQRGRVVRLIELSGIRTPRHGSRTSPRFIGGI